MNRCGFNRYYDPCYRRRRCGGCCGNADFNFERDIDIDVDIDFVRYGGYNRYDRHYSYNRHNRFYY